MAAVVKKILTIINNVSQIGLVIALIEKMGNDNNLRKDKIMEMMLAAEEMICNIINYGYDDEKVHEISVSVVLKEDLLRVEIRDDASAFDPLDVPPPESLELPAQQRLPGGLGIHLARKLTDRITYRRKKNKNVLILEKDMTLADK
ncbi:MAG TPA: ATP-binding protein [Bacteroidales bacterium]|nr:ATP-binding protein [Bacteroidales bacterium]